MTAGGLVPSQTYKDLAARADNTAGKVLSALCVPKVKFSILNCWFLARFNSRKAEQYFSQERSLTQRYVNHRVLENSM